MFGRSLLCALVLPCALAGSVEYTMTESDSISRISQECSIDNQWHVQGRGKKFVHPYEAGAGTQLRLPEFCVSCLRKTADKLPEGWSFFKTSLVEEQGLDEIALRVYGDETMADEFVTNINSGQKPATHETDSTKFAVDSCTILYYPIEGSRKPREESPFVGITLEAALTLQEVAAKYLEDPRAWTQIHTDNSGGMLENANKNTVIEAGEAVWFKSQGGVLTSPAEFERDYGAMFDDDVHTLKTAVGRTTRKWPVRRIIEYGVGPQISSRQNKVISDAVAHIERRTRVRFRRSSSNAQGANKVTISRSDRSWASLGKSAIGARMGLDSSAGVATVVQKFGHILGIHHEQSRTDRDKYVRIDFSKVPKSSRRDYLKQNTYSLLTRYDFDSIMHSGSGGGRIIALHSSNQARMGATRLSSSDVRGFNFAMGYSTSSMRMEVPECADDEDFHDSQGYTCQDWDTDDCANSDEYDLLKTKCPKACRQCTNEGMDMCVDTNPQCSHWGSLGLCDRSAWETDVDEVHNPETWDLVENSCCFTCHNQLNPTTVPECSDVESWTNVKEVKSDCVVLVEDFEQFGTCQTYCSQLPGSKTCFGAWDDDEGSFTPPLSRMECDEESENEMTDALCQCGTQHDSVGVPPLPEESAVAGLSPLSCLSVVVAVQAVLNL